jgi:hypothetical protein
VPPSYEQSFRQAEYTFLHQVVWHVKEGRAGPLTPITPELEGCDLSFAGR